MMEWMGSPRYQAVLIDFYGTIAAGDRAAVEATCATIVTACGLSISPAAFAIRWGERFFRVVAQSSHGSFRTLYDCEMTSLAETLQDMRVDADPAPFVARLEEYWRDPPIHADAVEFLRDVQVPVCVVSNADTQPLESAIRKHGLTFDAVISSESVRSYKPDGHIFRQALDRIGADAERTLHIGDSLHSDVAGAQSMGITAAWICRDDRIHDIGRGTPCRTCTSLTELMALWQP
jgi:2-haloacid dehalogenase/putative hydrolase of the HAD superfamily